MKYIFLKLFIEKFYLYKMSDEFEKDFKELKNIEKQVLIELKTRKEIKKEENTYKVSQN